MRLAKRALKWGGTPTSSTGRIEIGTSVVTRRARRDGHRTFKCRYPLPYLRTIDDRAARMPARSLAPPSVHSSPAAPCWATKEVGEPAHAGRTSKVSFLRAPPGSSTRINYNVALDGYTNGSGQTADGSYVITWTQPLVAFSSTTHLTRSASRVYIAGF